MTKEEWESVEGAKVFRGPLSHGISKSVFFSLH
jgi:hypothetical protein